MKKIVSIIIIFITFIFIYLFQANFFTWFNIAGVMPNLFIVFTMLIGIFIGKIYGTSIGIILGLFLDLILGKTLGINGISLGIAGFMRRIIYKKIFKRQ